jgi:hypothetical protein
MEKFEYSAELRIEVGNSAFNVSVHIGMDGIAILYDFLRLACPM